MSLFETFKIGNKRAKNRILVPPYHDDMAQKDGKVTARNDDAEEEPEADAEAPPEAPADEPADEPAAAASDEIDLTPPALLDRRKPPEAAA